MSVCPLKDTVHSFASVYAYFYFHELKFNLGHMFGFAYGEKENGSVFSHMAVMYANSLYRRGFAREGHKVLDALSSLALKKDIITRSGTESS